MKKITLLFLVMLLSACASAPPDEPERVSVSTGCSCHDMNGELGRVTQAIEKQKIIYSQSAEKADCSGIYHRVLDGLADACPCMDRPDYQQHRTTRRLANWYHQRGELQRVDDPRKAQDLIRVGVVMFYGYQGRSYKKAPIEDFFKQGKGIVHMGVVVDVERDADGNVVRYSLFHGRSSGKLAKATNYHSRRMRFGNGKQPWIAVASAY